MSDLPLSTRDPYRGVILTLSLGAVLGAVFAFKAGLSLPHQVLLAAGTTLVLQAGVLVGVAVAQHLRARPITGRVPLPSSIADEKEILLDTKAQRFRRQLTVLVGGIKQRLRAFPVLLGVRTAVLVVGVLCIAVLATMTVIVKRPMPWSAGIVGALCVVGAGIAIVWIRYLNSIHPESLPEAPGLQQWGRIVAWVLVLTAASMGLSWFGQTTLVQLVFFLVVGINCVLCVGLFLAKVRVYRSTVAFPLDSSLIAMLGSRPNVLASILDAGEAQLGIDLRSTWALTIVRTSFEPLLLSLVLAGWLSTSLTVIGVDERGLVERFGVSVSGAALAPGLHVHWPWPIDKIARIPVLRVQAVQVGHEGEEDGGPENVFWAVEHAPNEYTLLLGNGRDLITIDAAVQFRIADPRAWRYHCQNPTDALRAIAYRAVMRNTVNRTLSEALSENVLTLTSRMRAVVQKDADALDLGVEVLGFTVGGMHPPVAVAKDYQAVVSSELRKVTTVVNAQTYRNKAIPGAQAVVVIGGNTAQAEGVEEMATAAGEAWSFRTLQSQYRASPAEFLYRRRLETLEKGLASKMFTVVDSRFQRDGGEIWIAP